LRLKSSQRALHSLELFLDRHLAEWKSQGHEEIIAERTLRRQPEGRRGSFKFARLAAAFLVEAGRGGLPSNELFSDGFETGNTAAWSQTGE